MESYDRSFGMPGLCTRHLQTKSLEPFRDPYSATKKAKHSAVPVVVVLTMDGIQKFAATRLGYLWQLHDGGLFPTLSRVVILGIQEFDRLSQTSCFGRCCGCTCFVVGALG